MEDLSGKIAQKIKEAKEFINDPQTKEKAQEMYGKVKTETVQLFDKTKEKFNEVKEDERVKDFINSASETLDETITTINESETFNKVKENVTNTFENIKNDENVQAGVKKAKKATLSFAKKALSSIEKMLEDEEEEVVVVHEVVDDATINE